MVQLEPLDGLGVVGPLLRERRHLGRKVVHEGRLHQPRLAHDLEQLERDRPGTRGRRHLDPDLFGQRRHRVAVAQLALGHLLLETPTKRLADGPA